MSDPLAVELRALGRSLDAPVSAEFSEGVMARVLAEPTPVAPSWVVRVRGWIAARWRSLVGALTAVVLVGALTPPVRAAVVEWLGLGAAEVRTGTGPPPSSAPPPPTASGVSLAEARALVSFPVVVPALLGEPESVEVVGGQVVSMSWRGGTVRMDQVGGTLSPMFVKTVYDRVEFTTVRGGEALWLESPHHLVVNVSAGDERITPPRLAGPTLIWTSGGVTLRLEGDFERAEAVAIAESGTSSP